MAKIDDLLDFQHKTTLDLLDILEQEKLAIARRVASDIEALANAKIELITQLQQTDERIATHPHLDQLQQNPLLARTVQAIKTCLNECQLANVSNGQALARAQLSYNKLNNMLQQCHGKIGMTYNAGGQTHTISTLGTNLTA